MRLNMAPKPADPRGSVAAHPGHWRRRRGGDGASLISSSIQWHDRSQAPTWHFGEYVGSVERSASDFDRPPTLSWPTRVDDDIDDFNASIDPSSMRNWRHIRTIGPARQAWTTLRSTFDLPSKSLARRAIRGR